jgi:CO/xanthine dehydrogenase FAD-binding subunit
MDGTRLSDGLSDYARPTCLDEALALLSSGPASGLSAEMSKRTWTILAGGTDYFPGLRDRPPSGRMLDLSGVEELRGIREARDHWRIGGLTTWSEIAAARLPAGFDALKSAALEVGSVQIQNRGTVAGNLCNASPAADGVPPLMVLDAEIVLRSSAGERRMPLGDFILGNRTTALGPGELLAEIIVPKAAAAGSSHFVKLGSRTYLVISIAMVAARLAVRPDGLIDTAAISIGACSPVARRLRDLEQRLVGQPARAETFASIGETDMAGLSPIDDVRASAAYRLEAAAELTRRALIGCLTQEAAR